MSYDIRRISSFSNHLKDFAKKYPSVKQDYETLLASLKNEPQQGTSIGRSCCKVRMKISSKNSGKSGGARVITLVRIKAKRITLLDVYDKSDKESISDKELTLLLKEVED